MRKLTNAFLLIGASFLLFGSIGINVFFHSCDEDGTIVSYIIEADHSCSADEEEAESCCLKDQEKETEDDGCCDDEVQNFKLKLDFFQDAISGQVINAEFQEQIISIDEILETPHFSISNYANPPPKSRKKRISQQQVWII